MPSRALTSNDSLVAALQMRGHDVRDSLENIGYVSTRHSSDLVGTRHFGIRKTFLRGSVTLLSSKPLGPMSRTLIPRIAYAAAALFICLGCASVPQPPPRVPKHIPFPTATPFDASPAARSEYLEGYRRGYLQAYGGCTVVGKIYKEGHIPTPSQRGADRGNYEGTADWIREEFANVSGTPLNR